MIKSFLYLLSVYSVTVLNTIFSYLSIQVLSLTQLGELSLLRNLQRTQEFSNLGFRTLVDRGGVSESNSNFKNVVGANLFLVSIFFVISIIITLFLFDFNFFFALAFITLGYFYALIALLKSYYRAKGMVYQMLWAYLLPTSLQLSGQIFVILIYDFDSFVLFTLLSSLIGIIILWFKILFLSSFINLFYILKKHFLSCLHFYSGSLVLFLYIVMERVLFEQIDGVDGLGKFSILLFFIAAIQIFPNALGELVYNRIAKIGYSFFSKKIIINILLLSIISQCLFLFGVKILYDIAFPELPDLKDLFYISTLLIYPFSYMAIMPHFLNVTENSKIYIEAVVVAVALYFLLVFYRILGDTDVLIEFLIYKIIIFSIQPFYIYIRFLFQRRIA